MGFVHHSLSYDHIVFDVHPLITKIIDFKSVRPVESKEEIEFEGSKTFYPTCGVFRVGDRRVDHYALVSMIVHLFITKDFNSVLKSQ